MNRKEEFIQFILNMGESEGAAWLVTPEEFFDGNDDLGSIGCNISNHPGLDVFQQTIMGLRDLPGVESVWMEITDLEEGEWPFSETVLVFGSVDESLVQEKVTILHPSEVDPHIYAKQTKRCPELLNQRCVVVWWD